MPKSVVSGICVRVCAIISILDVHCSGRRFQSIDDGLTLSCPASRMTMSDEVNRVRDPAVPARFVRQTRS